MLALGASEAGVGLRVGISCTELVDDIASGAGQGAWIRISLTHTDILDEHAARLGGWSGHALGHCFHKALTPSKKSKNLLSLSVMRSEHHARGCCYEETSRPQLANAAGTDIQNEAKNRIQK